ncbi:hypothetical protein PG985_008425 [Apiospora marii]|uniref:Ribosome assembly protein 3 n=1 Tax=Apiospora marii TaxID=335849 RepID=A0ABR1SRY9_9PEZI
MPPKRAAKRKSAGDAPKQGGSQLALARGSRSEPRPSAKRPKVEPEEPKDGSDWIKWIRLIQNNEAKYYKQKMDDFYTGIQGTTDKAQESLSEQIASHQPAESESGPILESAQEIVASLRLDDSRKEGDAFFQQMQDTLAASFSLLALHKDTEEALKGKAIDTSILSTWKKDRRDMKEVLAKGREHGMKIVANHLAPGTFSPSDLDNDEAGEHEKKAASMFQDFQQPKPEDSWGPAAYEQFELFQNLAKSAHVEVDADGQLTDVGHGSDSRMT